MFLEALLKEIEQTRHYLGNEAVNTIYFGGGTPSVYAPGELQELLERIYPGPASEITLELNPEDVTESFVDGLKSTWFNRFSIGIQSFFDEDLVALNRSHSAGQAILAVNLLHSAGYRDLSIDLIYGIPTSSAARWEKNLGTAFSLGIPHISAYALTVEPGTPLAWMIARKRSAPVSEELQNEQFEVLLKKTEEHGFLQYEISNFCKPGHYSLHNTNYWKGVPYLGLGPSAHSYNGLSRRWNVSNLSGYISGIGRGDRIYEEEMLTAAQKYNEYVMTSLRTMWGCDHEKILSDFGFRMAEFFTENAAPLVTKGFLAREHGCYFLTDKGKLFADRISSDLFIADE